MTGIEIKRDVSLASLAWLAEASLTARLQSIYVTDGRNVSKLDRKSGTDLDLRQDHLPLPDQFDVIPAAVVLSNSSESGVSVLYPETMTDFTAAIDHETCVIVDHTLRWGDRSPRVERIRSDTSLPAYLQRRLLSTLPFVLAAVGSAKPKALVAISPQGLLSSEQSASLRSYLNANLGVRGVVALSPGLLAPHTNIATAMLALGDFGEASETIIFAQLDKTGEIYDVEHQHWWILFADRLSGRAKPGPFCARADSLSWDPALHSPDVKKLESRFRKLGPVFRADELFEIHAGVGSPVKEVQRGGIKVIRGRDIRAGVSLRINDLNSYANVEPDKRTVAAKAGDIVIQRIGTSPSATVVGEDVVDAVASSTVFLLRAKTPSLDATAVAEFLNSSAAQQVIGARRAGGHVPTLTLAALRDIPILVLPTDVTADLRDLYDSEQQLRAEADKLEAMRTSVFSAESIDDVRETLRQVRQTSNSVTRSVEKAEDFEFQVRNFYPFPIAYGYRQLASLVQAQELYREQLRMAENLLAFVGSLSLALAIAEGCEVKADLKASWRGGISPGHWRDIATSSSSVLEDRTLPLGRSLNALWTNRKRPRFDLAIEDLIKAKNDYKHDRGPITESDLCDNSEALKNTLILALKKMSFLVDHPIQYVCDQDAVRHSSRVIVRSLALRGDHPAWPQDARELPVLLKKNDVYIEISSDEWVDLYPFITIQTCSMCKARETYFIDRCDFGKKTAILKSFERGHTTESHDIGKALTAATGGITTT
jgi:hypothetical protein